MLPMTPTSSRKRQSTIFNKGIACEEDEKVAPVTKRQPLGEKAAAFHIFYIMLARELSAVGRGTPTNSGSLMAWAGLNVLPGCKGDVNSPTTGGSERDLESPDSILVGGC